MTRKSAINMFSCLAVAVGLTLGLSGAADAATSVWFGAWYPNNTYNTGTISKSSSVYITGQIGAYGRTSSSPGRFAGSISVNTDFYARYDFAGEYACTNMPQRAPFPNNDSNVYGFGGSVSVNCTNNAQPGGSRVNLAYR